jgi:hypothetical protein
MEDDTIRGARILVVAKAYPQKSRKYEETVCTAGLLNGNQWIRIYPIPFRFMDEQSQYKKYTWISLDLQKREAHKDFRPESFRPLRGIQEEITLGETIPTGESGWEERRKYLLSDVYTSLDKLIDDAYGPLKKSLAVLKPDQVIRAEYEKAKEKEEPLQSNENEYLLFDEEEWGNDASVRKVEPLPYTFYYKFISDNKPHRLQIEDWEIGALYWKMLRGKTEKDAINSVLEKLTKIAKTKDLYLILGTVFRNHRKGTKNPFSIIGLFYPPHKLQFSLDL